MVVHLVSGEDSPFTPVAVLRIPPPRLSPFSINVSPQRISQFGPESQKRVCLAAVGGLSKLDSLQSYQYQGLCGPPSPRC